MSRIGSYKLESRIGAGGHGEVYRATHPVLGRPVAVKVLHDAIARDAALRERFLREARLTLDLNYPGIVNVYDIGADGDRLYTVMELFEHGSLADAVERQRLPLSQALDAAADVADTLGYAHRQGVVHRDIKPSNILLRGDGTPVVADFGLAIDPAATRRVTGSGEILGTPVYMSPEQLEGGQGDTRSDMYSFGVMLYEMVAGRVPFDGTLAQIVQGHLSAAPPPLRDGSPNVPPALESLVGRMLAKDPRRRPAGMEQVAAELRAIRATQPATGPTIRVPAAPARRAVARAAQPGAPVVARRPWIVRYAILGGLLLGTVILVAIFALSSVLGTPDRRAAAPPPLTPIALKVLSEPAMVDPQPVVLGQEQWTIGSTAIFQDAASIRAYGLLRLDGDSPRKNASVRLILLDNTNAEIISKEQYTSIYFFGPGDMAAIDLQLDSSDGQLPIEGTYKVRWEVRSADGSQGNPSATRDVTVTDVAFGRIDQYRFGWRATLGVVDPTRRLLATAVLFDADGRVVGVGTTAVDTVDSGDGASGVSARLSGSLYELEKQPSNMVVLAEADLERPE